MHGRIGALDLHTGEQIWQKRTYKLGTHYTVLPLMTVGNKLFYSASGMIGCLGLKAGELVWEADIFFTKNLHYEQSCLAASQDGLTVFIANCQHVVAYESRTGHIKWSAYLPSVRTTFPCVFVGQMDTVFVAGAGSIVCLDGETGTSLPRARARFDDPFPGSLCVFAGGVTLA